MLTPTPTAGRKSAVPRSEEHGANPHQTGDTSLGQSSSHPQATSGLGDSLQRGCLGSLCSRPQSSGLEGHTGAGARLLEELCASPRGIRERGCKSSLRCLLFSHSVVSDPASPMDRSTPGFLSFTVSRNLLKLMSIESMMPFNRLILCHPLLLLPSITWSCPGS